MNQGFDIELDIVKALKGHKYKQLNDFLKHCMKVMYPTIKENDEIQAYKYENVAKTDIVVIVNNQEKCVSVKSGNAKHLHEEGIKTFILFLRELNVSEETQKTILYYHYGDMTMTGLGKKRYTYQQLLEIMHDQLKEANQEINKKEIIEKTVERFIFTGGHTETKPVDYIIFGNDRYGSIASKQEIINYSTKKDTSFYNVLHVGPIIIRPKLRDIDFTSIYQYKRDLVCGSWKDLLGDVMKIDNQRRF